jgi:hypothetical protein
METTLAAAPVGGWRPSGDPAPKTSGLRFPCRILGFDSPECSICVPEGHTTSGRRTGSSTPR